MGSHKNLSTLKFRVVIKHGSQTNNHIVTLNVTQCYKVEEDVIKMNSSMADEGLYMNKPLLSLKR